MLMVKLGNREHIKLFIPQYPSLIFSHTNRLSGLKAGQQRESRPSGTVTHSLKNLVFLLNIQHFIDK